tara:strand:- start:787 stop:1221 length:435 start_codon:yes stop_codon:yes gene_type:complete
MSQGNGVITRDSIRSKLLATKPRKTKIYTTDEGVDIEIRQPTVGQRGRMLKAAGITATNTEIQNITSMQVAAIVECTYVPGGEQLFDWNDEETLASLPTSSWFDEVANLAMETMNVEGPAAGKRSQKTKSDSTSSSSEKNLDAQ